MTTRDRTVLFVQYRSSFRSSSSQSQRRGVASNGLGIGASAGAGVGYPSGSGFGGRGPLRNADDDDQQRLIGGDNGISGATLSGAHAVIEMSQLPPRWDN